MSKSTVPELLKIFEGQLITSVQALPDEPLYGSETIVKMADAALMGGAVALRVQSSSDISSVKAEFPNVPLIGLIKRDYPDSEVFITATLREIDEVIDAGADIVALDMTARPRPNAELLPDLVQHAINKGALVMADVSNYEEGITAEKMGAHCISTTLSGYTDETKHLCDKPDFELVKKLSRDCSVPVIAEGRIWTPEEAVEAINSGAFSVVVGSAITRPQLIAKRFSDAVKATSK
ncbi:N-acetylmannosamine-6-phosphate 2-epimerase [Salinivibrio sp. IB643]|uniref:N-acetylmannosamine-6-phosphate 2-epimerase n=1 Tax=Salinivibrio sp. IB643 TaxID=1909445 RepID=UPI0009896608|nr:N-acetylmannosamine-6-phosphate 2-epimerase [Salinivibrio sp. IB643]OOE94809.1 N-acetylmannosamine-6-phosphate 2-epimerase [Salinivibrio sp. IB643]